VLRQTLQGLEPVAAGQPVYWHELVRFVLGWTLSRRPPGEYDELIRAAKESQSNVQFQQEVAAMSQQLAKAREDEINDRWRERLQQAEQRIEQRLQRAEQRIQQRLQWAEQCVQRIEQRVYIAALQAILHRLLQKRFGPLPEDLGRRIEAADFALLEAALDQVLDLTALEQLQL